MTRFARVTLDHNVGVSDGRPRIGISACLLGQEVRYDAGHKRDPFLVDTFGAHVEWVPVCPEVEAGFGTPRDPMRLVLTARDAPARGKRFSSESIALIVVRTGADVSDRLRKYAIKRVDALIDARLSGYILKKDSPSCGMERVKVYDNATPRRAGRGLFAEALMSRLPTLPVEDEGRLSNARLCENFIERIFAFRRLRALFDSKWTVADLLRFHTLHNVTLMAHSATASRDLGRLVDAAARTPRRALASAYERRFMAAMSEIATPRRYANMPHMLGDMSRGLDADARDDILGLIEEQRRIDALAATRTSSSIRTS
jgi:uncharacterized protein YbbK (DUF523 family)/uncharacterized protein YbgA (DUF1722 family)